MVIRYRLMEKKRTNSDLLRKSPDKHSIYVRLSGIFTGTRTLRHRSIAPAVCAYHTRLSRAHKLPLCSVWVKTERLVERCADALKLALDSRGLTV